MKNITISASQLRSFISQNSWVSTQRHYVTCTVDSGIIDDGINPPVQSILVRGVVYKAWAIAQSNNIFIFYSKIYEYMDHDPIGTLILTDPDDDGPWEIYGLPVVDEQGNMLTDGQIGDELPLEFMEIDINEIIKHEKKACSISNLP
jgi:hypothetical protein